MRLIHRCNQISGYFFVTLLIVTQSLSPLIHGHGGYDEPVRGFHMPGFENLSRATRQIEILSANGFRYAGLELIIGVASGIETRYQDALGFDGKELFTLIRSAFSGIFIPAVSRSQAWNLIPAIRSRWTHQPSRAPPRI